MRLIDADALKADCQMSNDCKDCKTYVRDCQYDRIYTKMDFCGWLDDAPTVDAVPVRHGRWIWRNYPGYQYQCDQCKRWAMFESKFCPNCGALMQWWEDGDHHD